MHKKYIERSGGIIVIDDEDKMIEYNNDGDIDEVLKNENMVEILKDNKKILEDKIEKNGTPINPKFNLLFLLIFLIVILECQFLLPSTKIETVFGLMSFNSFMSLISVTVLVPFISCVTYILYKGDVKRIKEKKALEKELECLEKRLEEEQEKLYNLNKDIETKEVHPIKVDMKDELLKLKEELNRSYEIGYSEEKVYTKKY